MALLPWLRALHIASTLWIGGTFAFEVLVVRRCGDAARDPVVGAALRGWSNRLCAWGVAVALVSWAGWLAATAMGMSGLPFPQAATPEVIGTVISQTTFGHVWVIRSVLFVVLGALLWAAKSKGGYAACALAAFVLVASLAWTGHALGTNRVHVWVDALHLLAATAWLGMLPLLWAVMANAAANPATWRALGVACAKAFFVPGVTAVVVLGASGIANTSWMIDAPSDLWRTTYGRILALKVALFALMVLLASANRYVIVPRVQRDAAALEPLQALRTSVLIELCAGAAVLAVVAWLGVTPPAAHEHTMHEHQMQDMR